MLALLANAFMALVDAMPSPMPAPDHEAQILEIVAKVLTLVASLITLVLAPLVGAVILWNRRQQKQMDEQAGTIQAQTGHITDCEKRHTACELESVKMRERLTRVERLLHGGRDNGQ